jgi:hypothetical protein
MAKEYYLLIERRIDPDDYSIVIDDCIKITGVGPDGQLIATREFERSEWWYPDERWVSPDEVNKHRVISIHIEMTVAELAFSQNPASTELAETVNYLRLVFLFFSSYWPNLAPSSGVEFPIAKEELDRISAIKTNVAISPELKPDDRDRIIDIQNQTIVQLRRKVKNKGIPEAHELVELASKCRNKNGAIVYKRLAPLLGVTNKTAKSWCNIRRIK